MDVLLSDRQRRLPPAARILKAIARRVVSEEEPSADEVDLVLGDDALLADLNERFRNRAKPTDVLSFPSERTGGYHHLGEVVISTDRAVEQAPVFYNSVAEEMTRLLVHGLLHLVGYEHDTSSGRRRMRAAEARHRKSLESWVSKLEDRYRRKAP